MRLALIASITLLGSTALVPAFGQADPDRAKRSTRQVAKPAASEATTPGLPVHSLVYEKMVLPNGLTLIVHEDHKIPAVSIATYYHVGSANETPGKTGFAHLFEHLMFNGSENANTDWFKLTSPIGATGMNGTTGPDVTNYYEMVPKNALDRMLWLESDRMKNLLPAVDQAKLDEQRKVVQNEKRQRANDPLGEVEDLVFAATYLAGHPYSWSPIGSMEDLNAANLDDVRTFFKQWYSPNNAVLVLAGDITPAEAREKVGRYYGDIPPGPDLKRNTQWIPRMSGESRGKIKAVMGNSQLRKIWNIPGLASRDTQLLKFVGQALTQGSNSRLERRLVRELGLATAVSAEFDNRALVSQFSLVVTAKSGVSLAQLEAALNDEIAAFLRDGVTSAELERLKFIHYAGTIKAQFSTLRKAMLLAEGEIYAGDPDFDSTLQRRLYTATPASILEVARRWLSDGAYVLEAEAVSQLAASDKSPDRSIKPPVGPAVPFSLPPQQHATLSNGIKLSLVERHDVPAISVVMAFPIGRAPDRDPLVQTFPAAVGQVAKGTKTRSREEIEREQQDLGASLGWGVQSEYATFGLSALKLKMDPSLDLFADLLLNPTFPETEWERDRDLFIAGFEASRTSINGKMANAQRKFLYGPSHPYAARMTPEKVSKLTTGDLRRSYEKWVRPDLATLFVSGDTTLAEIMPALERRLRNWRAVGPTPVKPPMPAFPRIATPRVILVDQPGAPSSLIHVALLGAAKVGDPDYDLQLLANSVIGGSFNARLNMKLREEKGWSYGVNSQLQGGVFDGLFRIEGSVQTDKTADAMHEIAREVREFGTTRPPSAGEVASAKDESLLVLYSLLESPDMASTLYASSYLSGLPEEYWNTRSDRVRAFTLEDIAAAAKRLSRPSELTWFVVGDLSKIEADIRAHNFGDVQVVDADGNRIR